MESTGGDAEPAAGAPETLSFGDRWQGGRHAYLAWLEARLRAFRPLLAPRGVFLLHLDWHVVHYAKVLCDTIFGDDRFQNELIWYYQTGGASKDRFSRKHDTILLYSNGPTFHFDGAAIAIPRTPKAMKRAHSGKGARIATTDTHKNPDDVVTIPALNPMAIERTGYPTQKPVGLLEMLIKALCRPGGGVADLFCGSGTTLAAAQRLGRRWVGCDINPAAVEMARERIAGVVAEKRAGPSPAGESLRGRTGRQAQASNELFPR
jgi:DNA modification methylase